MLQGSLHRFAATLAALGPCAAACQDEQAKDPIPVSAQIVGTEQPPHEIGQTASNGVFQLRVLGVQACNVEAHFEPPTGIRKLGIHVEIQALSEAEVPINPFYAMVVDAEGRRFEPTLAGCQPVLEARRVTEGQTARGWVSFDVPEDLRGGRFQYAPVVMGVGKKELEFALDAPPVAH